MKIKYWTSFSKRKNSTKRPSSGTEIDVTLKVGTTIEEPTFILADSNAPSFSYVEAFGHYYFITDIKFTHNQTYEVACSQDVLATYKSQIGSTTAFVERAASSYNVHLIDDVVSTTNQNVTAVFNSSGSMPFNQTGCYIVSVVNDEASDTGYVCNYIVHWVLLQGLAEWLSGEGSYGADTWSDIQSDLFMQFGDCFSCIRSVKWIPVDYNTAIAYGTSDNLKVGKYYTGVFAYRLTSNGTLNDSSTSITFSSVPYADDFRMAAPYTSCDIFIPYYGLVSVDPAMIGSKIWLDYSIDLTTGDCYVRGLNVHNKVLFSINYDIGVETPIAQVGRTAMGIAAGAISTVGHLVTGNLGGALASGLGLVSSIASNGVSQKGALSGRAMSKFPTPAAYLTYMVTTSITDHAAVQGRPLMDTVTISSLSGYIKCAGASVSISGPGEDRDEINSYLNSGFFYE